MRFVEVKRAHGTFIVAAGHDVDAGMAGLVTESGTGP